MYCAVLFVRLRRLQWRKGGLWVSMGLSVYHTLRLPRFIAPVFDDVLVFFNQLRDAALEGDFDKVSELKTYVADVDMASLPYHEERDLSAVHLFGEFPSMLLPTEKLDKSMAKETVRCIMPLQGVAFSVLPGKGCETAWIGVGLYPEQLMGIDTLCGSDWFGTGFCKTQYACLTGTDNFLRAHGNLIELFDVARSVGFEIDVSDDSGYWEHRDEEKLLEHLEYMNQTLAAFAGAFKDAMEEITPERQIRAPILEHPRFEYLEARGVEELRRRRKR